MRKVIITPILQGFDQKNHYFEGWSWFKLNNLGWALDVTLKLYISVAKGLKIKGRRFWGLCPTFIEVTWEVETGRRLFWPPHPTPTRFILNRVNTSQIIYFWYLYFIILQLLNVRLNLKDGRVNWGKEQCQNGEEEGKQKVRITMQRDQNKLAGLTYFLLTK